ncbi:MAG: helix-turn-helix transcriptional regulator [Chloroflexota bacterium]
MSEFGDCLRKYRERCTDPNRAGQKLSQRRLGELLGTELGLQTGYTGAAVSDWERGESKIHADDRLVLISLVKVLHQNGGLKSTAEANELLEAGNYRALDATERQATFHEEPPPQPSESKLQKRRQGILSLLETVFPDSAGEIETLLTQVEEGPSPAWPRLVVALFRKSSDHLTVSITLRFLLWVWVWLLTQILLAPSLRWPFPSQETAVLSVVLYAVGTMILPLFIGALTDTINNKFWQEQEAAEPRMIRLYTYQGAFIGFHLGYFFFFALALFRQFIHQEPTIWFELISATLPVVLGYIAARLIPYNLWQAYGRLYLRDGAIFFVFTILGPGWAWFFLEYHQLLIGLDGLLIVLLAFTLLAGAMAWQYRRNGTTVFPLSWWIIFYALILICEFLAVFLK